MLRNYFLIGWRNLVRTKGFSIINISGLATGMAVTILIGLWVYDEVSFNKSFQNYDHLGQVYHNIAFGDEIITINDVPAPIGEALKSKYPDFENVSIASWPSNHFLTQDDKKLSETGLFVDTAFLDMFSIRMLQGKRNSIKDIHTLIVSRTLAASLAHGEPIGQMIKFDNHDQLMVVGVYDDFPQNSEFADVKFLVPLAYFNSIDKSIPKELDNWDDYGFQCFVQLKNGASFQSAGSKMKKLLDATGSNDVKAVKPEGFIYPMAKWHLYSEFKDGHNTGGHIKFIWMISTIGIFVLFLAVINFVNLSTARSQNRSKEIGLRKVMGSEYKQLVLQFLTESFLIVFIAMIISLLIVALSLPWFNQLVDKKIEIPWSSPEFILWIGLFLCVTSLLAGSYPALYMSSFNPVKVLKGSFTGAQSTTWPRRVMVVFQFTVSSVLIAETIVVFQQI
ncbi:MAG: ABC transporter permease, partial [Chryseolinea sp.]